MQRIGLVVLLAVLAGAWWVWSQEPVPAPQVTVIEGTVSDGDGRGIPGAVVILKRGMDGEESVRVTDSVGHYEFRGIAPDGYRLRVTAKGYL
jgi:protocatechuate 3,4-dioxygenase beta subunit